MALLGLGLQGQAEAVVEDRGGRGGGVVHRLAFGEVVELNGPAGDAARAPTMSLPTEDGGGMSGFDLAVAGALAPIVGRGRMWPIMGEARREPMRWWPAAAGVALAVGIAWLAERTETWRYQRAIAALEIERAAHAGALAEVRAARERTTTLVERIETIARAERESADGDLLAAFDAVRAALPAGAFLYRVEVDGGSLTIKGEAKRAGDVLRAVEETEAFEGAKELDAPVTVEERGLETFNIRAERVRRGGEGA
jgi:hypothetical protein